MIFLAIVAGVLTLVAVFIRLGEILQAVTAQGYEMSAVLADALSAVVVLDQAVTDAIARIPAPSAPADFQPVVDAVNAVTARVAAIDPAAPAPAAPAA